MKSTLRTFASGLAFLFALSGCCAPTVAEANSALGRSPANDLTVFWEGKSDDRYSESSCVLITLDGDTAQCRSNTVSISGSIVTLTQEGTYLLRGTLEDGMLLINAEKSAKIHLVLDGVSICSATSAAIYVSQADKLTLTLAPGSQNALSNGGVFQAIDEHNIDAALFSREDLILNGSGGLTVSSPAGHGIVSKDDLVITDGIYFVDAAGHGLSGKDRVGISGGSFTVTSGKDGIHSENTDDADLGSVYLTGGSYCITSEGDGISASASMRIDGGSYQIFSGGGSASITPPSADGWGFAWDHQTSSQAAVSAKGIKSDGALLITAGRFTLDCADDAIHSNASLAVTGGELHLSTGDDGLHADAAVSVAGGAIAIPTSYEGIEGQSIRISGGEIDLTASDDGLNAAGGSDHSGLGGFQGFSENDPFAVSENCSITISGGIVHINASGDGIDSNGSLSVSGGEIYVFGPTNDGNSALDYNLKAEITGGVFLAAGSSGMAQNFTSAAQGAALINLSGSEGTEIILSDSAGNTLLSWTAPKSFRCVLISMPELQQGQPYTLSADNQSQTFTLEELVYSSAGMGGGFGGGFRSENGFDGGRNNAHSHPGFQAPNGVPGGIFPAPGSTGDPPDGTPEGIASPPDGCPSDPPNGCPSDPPGSWPTNLPGSDAVGSN